MSEEQELKRLLAAYALVAHDLALFCLELGNLETMTLTDRWALNSATNAIQVLKLVSGLQDAPSVGAL